MNVHVVFLLSMCPGAFWCWNTIGAEVVKKKFCFLLPLDSLPTEQDRLPTEQDSLHTDWDNCPIEHLSLYLYVSMYKYSDS